MLSLIIVSLVAGACLGQDMEYGDCDKVSQLAEECATAHLAYVKTQPGGDQIYTQMQTVGNLNSPPTILPFLGALCNDTMELKKYYTCTFDKVAMCLEEANSTTVDRMPRSKNLADGVEGLCDAHDKMNMTCITMKMQAVSQCVGTAIQTKIDANQDPCGMSTIMAECTQALDQCKGGVAVREFQLQNEPRMCSTDAASQYLPSLLLMLVAFLFAHSTVAAQ